MMNNLQRCFRLRSVVTQRNRSILLSKTLPLRTNPTRPVTGYPKQSETWLMGDEEIEKTYVNFFNNEKHDVWDVRQGINDFACLDEIPTPPIIISVLRACRRINEYSMTIRYLECVQRKCSSYKKLYWPYILKQIQPTLDELGMNTPEELGYDKPELECSVDYNTVFNDVDKIVKYDK
ncbi:Cytochrome c oxidase subunit 5A, mitochondrial [Intoshia linei]|uniref:Cytochrome c oxidase subunit 5A, mitochondrial n=1 Tax=Intoshia linei TaxID=1819745 RepID=A0A177B431_9BILA|nr:Cytochrome c oxidase subunit 5A, mitochondrial [Intoshia linei]